MAYLIDSDWIIDHLENDPAADQLLDGLAPHGFAISDVTYMEVFQGVNRSPDPQLATSWLNVLVTRAPIVPFSIAVAERCAGLREHLRGQGRRVRSRALDLIVAATAMEHGLTLVTRNKADYRDIPNLKLL
jgi:predicted nucleic acid-binding protein